MPDDEKTKRTTVGTIHTNNLGMIDFSDSCLKLGAKVAGKPVRWTELDEDDWKILKLLLTKPLLPDGSTAAAYSKALGNIAAYAEAVINWYKEQRKDASR